MPPNHQLIEYHQEIIHMLRFVPPQGCRDPICLQQHNDLAQPAPSQRDQSPDDGSQRRHRCCRAVYDHGPHNGLHGTGEDVTGDDVFDWDLH